MAPRWLDGLADVLARSDAPCYVARRGAGRGGDRLPRPPRCAGLARTGGRCRGRRGPRRRPLGAGPRGPRRPHQRRRGLPLGAALGFDAVLLAPGAPTRSTGARSRSAMGAVFALPWTRLPDWCDALPRPVRRGLHHRGADPGGGRRPGRGGRRRRSTGSRWCSAPRATGSRRGGSRPPTAAPSSRCGRASTRSTSPPPPPSPATSPPAADRRLLLHAAGTSST